ncbi:Do family serine endopeptidase [Cyclobacterium marinum]|jgi:Do/DeqQ family serine protease|uniref:Protease Do n=1 Tax=Cyclobacterium marinum (strain ATCC 25205 / DSM 745 / LMG 13164 / NCIMB 1802) TaxID=880070 RepID=G0IUW4_CYCMS|nr:Do family serine endopeptidase [Cyclobacterium marinum]AEL26188.1 protease Do [Cyclobacterium marinum DSM 745]MBI0399546.1 Do family serine endopeptidase [Cyclobacterium marinum]MBR9776790.1 Do family serine endopeptidase [Cytophagales bacterium]|tara:strand:+ start:55970 stop:57451 length:1482 start_codon:yes stop_codon:yes gene_type:complete
MNRKQFFLGIVLASLIGGLVAVLGVGLLQTNQDTSTNFTEKQNASLVNWLNDESFVVPEGINFVASAAQVTPAVVHVRSTVSVSRSQQGLDPMEELFGFRSPRGESTPREGRSSGSGAVISEDGYIVTNNHVIENASKVEITLEDNRRYTARVIGADPTTDLALLKIEANNLPFIPFGDSDQAQIGEWVLAVGNPYELNSTVTAGIISAKSRNIGILRDENNLQVESFIQTDAAVNPGNSGGPLVNLNGEIIGINTAIASRTGGFSGYSFAVPSSIAKKVMDDLLEFGAVQRGLLGVTIQDVNADLEETLGEDIKADRGVFVVEVREGSGGEEAGLKRGDVIIGVDGVDTYTTSSLQERVARKRPGDKVVVKFLRDGKEMETTATLKNTSGDTKVVVKVIPKITEFEGVVFEDLKVEYQERLELEGGATITSIDNKAWREAGVQEGFIITKIGRTKILNGEDVVKALKSYEGEEVIVLGVYPNGQRSYYELDL